MENYNRDFGHPKSICENAIENLKAQLLHPNSKINIDDVRQLINELDKVQLPQNSSIIESKLDEDMLRVNVQRLQKLNLLQSRLQHPSSIKEKLKLITDGVVEILDADFARIWMLKPGDRCESDCIHAQVTEGEHVCRFRDRCLHLLASSGRYTHTNGEVHARVPFGCYKIGKIAAAEESKFLTNNVATDPRVHNNIWAKDLGLTSFAGYRLGDATDKPLGVLALFSKHPISPEDDSYLELIAHSTSWVLHSEWDEVGLHESEERYHNLMESIPDWIWEVDARGNYTYASPAVRNILGYEPEDMLGRSPLDFMHEDERERIGVVFKEIIAKRQPIVALENVNRHRDGRLIVLETNGNAILGDNGELKGYRGIDRDITARKQSEETLARERYLMNALMNNLPDYIYFKDKESRFIRISNALAKSFGLSVPEEAIGKIDFEFFSEEHARQAYNDEQEIIRSGKPLVKEERETWPDRSDTWVSTTKLPLVNQDGDIIGTFGISMDITERKEVEKALKESERLLRESQEVAGLGSFSWNISKGLWTSSNILDRIFGIDESYTRSLEGWLAIIHPDFREAMQKYVTSDVLGKKQKFDKEYKIINQQNGQEYWVHGLGQLEFDSNHQPVKLIGTIQNITERKLSEETIDNSKSKLSIALKIAHLGAWEYDIASDLFTFNDSFYAIFRTNADQVGGNTMSSADYANRFVCTEDLSMVGDEIRMSLETDNPDYSRQFEHRIKYADGGIGYIAVRIGIVKDENGRTIKTFGINQDITERKKAENEIISNSKRLKALVDILQCSSDSIPIYLDFALSQAIAMTDSKMGYIYHYSEEKKEFVLNNTWPDETMSESKMTKTQTVYQLKRTGLWGDAVRQRKPIFVNDYHASHSLRKGCPAGDALLQRCLTIPVFNNDQIVSVVVVANKETDYIDADIIQLTVLLDIVWKALEKKQSDIALRESEEKLSTLFGSMTEMLALHELVFDEQGEAIDYRIIDCNKAFTQITGIKKEDAIGRTATEVYHSEKAPYLDIYAKVAITGESYEFDTYYEPMDKYFMISVVSPRENIFATITKDVSEIQQNQEEIKAKSKDLENFIYITSHDLRSPLVNLHGFSQRLQDQMIELKEALSDKEFPEDEKIHLAKIMQADIPKSLNFIMQNVFKMDTLINGLLQLSRTGRMGMTVKRIDMNQMFDAIVKNYNFQLTEINAEIIVDPVTDCYGDENLLNQLFSNIIGNAIKYRDVNRKLVVEIFSQLHFNKVIYCVKDNGLGINERHLMKIWDVFYRVDPTSSEVGEGLGLSLAKKIAERNKGKIWAESEEGEGSTFYIELQKNEFSEY